MKKRNQRFLSLLLALLMVVSLLPTAAFAAVRGEDAIPMAAPAADEDGKATTATPAVVAEEVPAVEDDTPAELAAVTNIAQGKETSASSDTDSGFPSAKAVDGDDENSSSSYWATGWGSTQLPSWLQIDLGAGASATVENMVIKFRNDQYSNDYTIATSATAAEGSWTTVYTLSNRSGAVNNQEDTISYTDGSSGLTQNTLKRYVRITFTSMAQPTKSLSVLEWKINGELAGSVTPGDNLARLNGVTATSSGNETNNFTPEKVFDGDTSTNASRWSSQNTTTTDPAWIIVDLHRMSTVTGIDLYWQRTNVLAYKLEVSSNKQNWTTVHSTTTRITQQHETFTFDTPYENVRYVRVYSDNHDDPQYNGQYVNISLYEIEISGTPTGELIPSASSVLANLRAVSGGPLEINSEGTKVVLKEAAASLVPGGLTATFAANLEQVVGAGGVIYTPAVDKEVAIDLTVTDDNDPDDSASTPANDPIRLTIPRKPAENETEANNAPGNPKPAVIPEIMEWYSHGTVEGYYNESYTLGSTVRILYRFAFDSVAKELKADLEDLFGVNVTLKRISGSFATLQGEDPENPNQPFLKNGDIVLYDIDPNNSSEDTRNRVKGYDEETYGMEIFGGKVYIYATHSTGAYWGTRTLLQGMKLSEDGRSFPNGTLRDYPEFKLRGFMLDVGRKPLSMDMLKTIAKNMAWYKLNDFHLHLNDNLIFMEDYSDGKTNHNGCAASAHMDYQSAYEAYSAFRMESNVQEEPGAKPLTAQDYAYTKAEFKQFIKEASALGINIVPEFDVPAHAKAITDAFPSLRLNKAGTFMLTTRPWIDHLDLTNKMDESLAKVQEIFDEYLTGSDPVFSGDVVDFGADEYYDDYSKYAPFAKSMVDYIQSKGKTVRMWGSFTLMGDNNHLFTKEVAQNIQMNIWSTQWANAQTMYDKGFQLININCYPGYIVPSGTGSRGNYGDRLNMTQVDELYPNKIEDTWIHASSHQMLGAAYAIWQDNIDTRACGLDEVDTFDRFYEGLPLYSERLWGARRPQATIQELSETTGTAPGTNPYYKAGVTGSFAYNFADNTDQSGNGHDLTLTNAEVNSSKSLLVLKGGASYAETGLDRLGWGNQLSFRALKLTGGGEEQILFEADHAYGDYAIKALPVEGDATKWKLGFSRELYDYTFDVELPVGEWVQLTLTAAQQSTTLSVNGEAAVAAVGKFVSKPDSNTQFRGKTGITYSSFELPVARIGGKQNAFNGYIAAVTTGEVVQSPLADNKYDIPTSKYTLTAGSEEATNHDGVEGPLSNAIDNNTNTYWHSNWNENLSTTPDKRWIQIELDEATEVSFLRYQPRPSIANGIVIEYRVDVSTDGATWETVSQGDWDHDTTAKLALFDSAVTAKYIRLYGVETRGSADDTPNKFMSCAEIRVCRPIDLTSDGNTTVTVDSVTWGETSAEATFSVKMDGALLTKDVDYTVTYANNTAAGEATATITGTGSYTGSVTATFTVPAKPVVVDLSTATVTFAQTSYPLENGKAEPAPTVKVGNTTLLRGLDYTVTYENNTAVGTATATITGIGDYTGEKTATFTVTAAIVKKDLSNTAKTKVTLHQTTFPYEGAAITPEPVVTYDGETLVKGTHYTVSYTRNNAVGTATVTVTGRAPYCEGSASATFTIVDPSKGNDLSDVTKTVVTLKPTQYEYTGKPITPTFTVTYNGTRLRQDTHYTVELNHNVEGGTGVLVITGTGDYYGSFVATFTINGGGAGTGNNPGNSSGNSSGSSSSAGIPSPVVTSTEITKGDGVTTTIKTDSTGAMIAQSNYDDGTKVIADIPVIGPVTAVVTVPARLDTVTVTIPTRGEPTPGQVAVILHPDGTEEIVKTSMPTEGGVELTLDASATVQIVDNAKAFTDVPAGNWAKDAIDFVTSREIFNGTGNSTFTPSGDMSRAMVCTVLANLAREDTKGGATWYEKSVNWAKQNGISDGSTPNATVTREQLAAMLYRYAGSPTVVNEVPRRFRDRDSVSDWAELAVTWAAENDLIRGRSSNDGLDLAPQATASRAEVAAVFQRYVALLK